MCSQPCSCGCPCKLYSPGRGCPEDSCMLRCVTHLSQAEGKGGSGDTWLPYGSPATCCSSLRHSLGDNGPGWAWNHFLVWGTSILSLQSWPGHKEPAQSRERERTQLPVSPTSCVTSNVHPFSSQDLSDPSGQWASYLLISSQLLSCSRRVVTR